MCVCYSDCDKQKDLSKWNKQELQAYLIHHNLKKRLPNLIRVASGFTNLHETSPCPAKLVNMVCY